jgi:hypothetical protein
MSTKKTAAKRVGASALAAATLISGLSFGAAAATAAPLDTPAPNANSQADFQLIEHPAPNVYRFLGYESTSAWASLLYTAPTLAEAKAKALHFTTESYGDDGFKIVALGRQIDGKQACINGRQRADLNACSSTPGPTQLWKQTDRGQLRSVDTVFNTSTPFLSTVRYTNTVSGSYPAMVATPTEWMDLPGDLDQANPGVENGGFDATGNGTAATVEAGKSTDVAFGMTADAAITSIKDHEVTVKAPTGTKFAAGQTTLNGQRRADASGTWMDNAALNLTGSVSPDGKTFTGTMADTPASFSLPKDGQIQWTANITADAAAPAATVDLKFSLQGTTNAGAYMVDGASPITITEATVTPPTAPAGQVTFDADVTKKATVSGTGATGSTIELFEGTKKLAGPINVAGGTWTTTIEALGAGQHTIEIRQTNSAGTQTGTTVADYGQAVAVNAPAATVDSTKVTLSGTAVPGAKIAVKDNTGKTRTTTANASDGDWTLDTWFRPDTATATVTAQSKGALTTTASTPISVNVTNKPIVVTSPTKADADNDRITDGTTRFTGTATPFSTVQFATWPDGLGREVFTTYADENGNWSADGWLAKSYYKLVGVEYAIGGYTNHYAMFPFSTVAFQPLGLTTPGSNDVVTGGANRVRFSGTATPGATVNILTWLDPRGRTITKAQADGDGKWTAYGLLAQNNEYKLVAE